MNFDHILKYIDPIISSIINKVMEGNNISESETLELFNSRGLELNLIVTVANYLCKRKKGDLVTYVINRNINFTNVCIKRCGFCAFSRDFREEEGYYLPIEEIIRRAKEAEKLGATEICIQAGLPPKMDGYLYIDICKAINKELPNLHIHAFSPEEILYGAKRSNCSIENYLQMLKEAGLGSIPGTAAEILDQEIRDTISPGRISVEDWIKVIKYAHSIGINSTSTIMYGHIESYLDIVKHLAILKNIQVSWVKEGPRMAQILLEAGVNDFGGTLINESISTSAGASFGQLLKPK